MNEKTQKGGITFRPGKDGSIEAVKDGKVIGHIWTNDDVVDTNETDGRTNTENSTDK